MKHIKLFEEHVDEMWLKTETAKMKAWLDKALAKVKDSTLAQEIRRYGAMHEIDPYETFDSFVDHVKQTFGKKVDFNFDEITI
jgi:hypothetical protein